VTSGCRAAIAHHPGLLQYDFGPAHPLRPERITASLDLLEELGIWSPSDEVVLPSPASIAELESVHSLEYIHAVDEASGEAGPTRELARFGLTAGDNPAFPGMHVASALVAGATLEATRLVLSGTLDHAFSPAGGLHHAHRARASGFCIYNDPAIAAAVAVREYRAKVFYVDFDCHHGDGVQWLFYNNPEVMTVSLHESGRFLFPGTGDVNECGEGAGRGYSVNLPFAPFSRDADWLTAVETLLPPLVRRFQPDIIISNHGCDTHAWDPITHLCLSTASFTAQVSLVHRLAHEYCDGRIVAVGSGGYDWRRVVPRSWAIVWSELAGRELPRELPVSWRARWTLESSDSMPSHFLDDESSSGQELHPDIARTNADTLHSLMRLAKLS
jgi:acetoin utilization protein AcuC